MFCWKGNDDVIKITNLYLYGQETTPDSKLDDSLVRPATLSSNLIYNVDLAKFMDSGGGRFAVGAQFELIGDPPPINESGWRVNLR